MHLKTISVGRTYNTGSYTSHRFDLEAELAPGEEAEQAMCVLAEALNNMAHIAMRQQGVRAISEPGGVVKLRPLAADNPDDPDDEDIPF